MPLTPCVEVRPASMADWRHRALAIERCKAMDFGKLGNLLAVVGALVLAAAFLWWFSFYSSVLSEVGQVTGTRGDATVFDAWHCFYSSGGICALISGIATLAGRTPYEPMLFWFGLAGLVLGVAIRLSAKRSGAA